jgi:hypothetical protein
MASSRHDGNVAEEQSRRQGAGALQKKMVEI